MFTKAFWKDAFERAISTAAQAVLTVMSIDGTGVVNINVNWKVALATAGFGALYALLKALVALTSGDNPTASFTDVNTYENE